MESPESGDPANDQLTEAQLDDTLSPDHYDASDLRVLEGLEAVRIRTRSSTIRSTRRSPATPRTSR